MVEIAGILLKLPDGRLVMQRRDGGAPTSPNMLSLFGGHIEPGELSDDAIKREVQEETSLGVASLNINYVFDCIAPNPQNPATVGVKVYIYCADIESADFEVYEGSGAEVYKLEELLRRTDISPASFYVLQNMPKLK